MRRTLALAAALSVTTVLAGSTTYSPRGIAKVGDRPTADVVVWLDSQNAPEAATQPTLVLDQRNLKFSPRVLAIRVGSTVEFPNNDRVFHNVFSFHNGQRFDLGLYPVGAVKRLRFDQPGVSRVFCNIHPQMAAYIVVVDTPYFTVSDEAGRFTFNNVPAGTYTYHAWRAGGPALNGSVAIEAETVLEVQWR